MKPLPRHERLPDLLAASEDKHVRKTRRIEFVGDQSPMENDRILANLLLGRYTPTQQHAIRRAAATAVIRLHGYSERLMEHDHQHAMATNRLQRTYRWHAGNNYIEDVDYRDVDAILGGPSGHQFRDLDAMEPDEPTVIQPSPEVFKLIALETYRRDDERLTVGQPVVLPFR